MAKTKQLLPSPMSRASASLASFVGYLLAALKVKPAVLLIKLRRFSNEYKLPLYMTTLFVVSIVGLAGVRYFEKSSLVSLLTNVTSGDEEYATLLISDKTDQFQRGSTDFSPPEETSTTNSAAPAGTSTSFTLNNDTPSNAAATSQPGAPSGTTIPTGGGNSDAGGSTGTGGDSAPDPTPAPAPFAASVAYFQNSNKSYDCPTIKLNKGQCSAVYTFSSGVSTTNGPGLVAYSWLSSVQAGNANGSYNAANGSSTTPLQRQVSLRCNQPQDFSMQFVIKSPTTVQSATLNVAHNCDDL